MKPIRWDREHAAPHFAEPLFFFVRMFWDLRHGNQGVITWHQIRDYLREYPGPDLERSCDIVMAMDAHHLAALAGTPRESGKAPAVGNEKVRPAVGR